MQTATHTEWYNLFLNNLLEIQNKKKAALEFEDYIAAAKDVK